MKGKTKASGYIRNQLYMQNVAKAPCTIATSTAVTVTGHWIEFQKCEKIDWCQQKAADSRASWVQLAVIGIDDFKYAPRLHKVLQANRLKS
jgi:hypothetical protein